MKVRIDWICHAATAAMRQARFPLDEPIEAAGRALAARLATELRPAGRIWAAPERRAIETAAALGLTAEPEAALRDCDYGCWAGRSLTDLASELPDDFTSWLTDPDSAPHGGESLADLVRRVAGWLDTEASHSGSVIAVTHAPVIKAAILYALRAPPASFWLIDVEPLAQVTMTWDGRRWALRFPGPHA
jgi:broad specificity phosphatase PhoE